MSWFKETIFFVGLTIAGKAVRDSLPDLDIRPWLRKAWAYINKALDFTGTYILIGLAYLIWSLRTSNKNQQAQMSLLIAIVAIAVVYKMKEWESKQVQQ
jgi:hypothetical protein